jgi:hypothetical protein
MNHPDAAQDQAQMAGTLAPVLELLAGKMDAYETRIAELEQVVMKLITGAYDAVSSHKRMGLMENIGSSYGPKLEPYKKIYGKTMGRDLAEDIVDMLQSNGIEGEAVEAAVTQFLNMVEDRFGEFVSKPAAIEVEVSAEGAPEAVVEEAEAEPEGEKLSPIDAMLKRLENVRKG